MITGATEGIGYELAKLMAAQGHNLILTARDESKLQHIKLNLPGHNAIDIRIFPADLLQRNSVALLMDFIRENNLTVDILVNNAGIGLFGRFTEIHDWKMHENVLMLNINALTELTHALLPFMLILPSARIMNISSTAAFLPGPQMAVYYASKAYVNSFTMALRTELRGSSVTVTLICPGPTDTLFQERAGMQNTRFTNRLFLADASRVAEFAYTKMMAGKAVAVYGLANRLMILLMRLIPLGLLSNIMGYLQSKLKKQA